MAAPKQTAAPEVETDLVEVRLIVSPRRPMIVDGVERRHGETFKVPRRIYEASVEPDRGMGQPAHSRTFRLLSDERTKLNEEKAVGDANRSRIEAMRRSVQDQESMREAGAASARVLAMEQTRQQAEALLGPLERPGAQRLA